MKAHLEKSNIMQEVVDFLNDVIETRSNVRIIMGGDFGPVYNYTQIYIPYLFLDDTKAMLLDARYYHHRENIDLVLNDILMHTIFHEFGHALIEQYEIPVLGREEDAADSLANFLVLHHFDDGPDILKSIADLFYLESKEVSRYSREDLAGEHSLDIQRYYMIMCHAYGSDPQKNQEFRRKAKFTAERAESCELEFNDMAYSWVTLLKRYLK